MEPITETILCMCSTLSLTSNKSSLAFIFSPSDRDHSVAIQLVEAGQVQPQIFGLQKIWRAAVAEDELSDGSPFRLPLVRKDSILSTWETRSFQRHFLKLPYLSGMREKMRFTRQVYLHWTRRLEGSLSQINEHDSFTSIDAKLSTKRKRTVTT